MPEHTLKRNKLLVRRYYEEVVGTGDVSRLSDFIAAGYTETYNNRRFQSGLDGARDHVLGVRAVFPDLRLTVDQQIAEGDWVVTCVTARGTQDGEWMGMQATGRAMVMTAVNVDRVEAGRIIEHGGAANLLEPLLASGAIQRAHPASQPNAKAPEDPA